MQKIRLRYKAKEAIIKLFNDYIVNVLRIKGRPSDLASCLNILTPKQMLQRLPTTHLEVKGGNTSEKLLNEIW